MTGETVSYTYDALNLLATAASSGGWSQSYVYDGFGNVQGANGAWVNNPDPATNRPSPNTTYDANGLPGTAPGLGGNPMTLLWDVENRLVLETNYATWWYDPSNKRVMGQGPNGWEIYFYGIDGRKLMTVPGCQGNVDTPFSCGTPVYNLYFAGKLIRSKGTTVVTDRLGSVRWTAAGDRMNYLPYGQELTSTTDNREKFGTYMRDRQGQDYADQRYYNQAGAFWSPDPSGLAAASTADPGSWNRYAYAQGDPVNFNDPAGRARCMVTGNMTRHDNPDNALDPVEYAEIQCQSEYGYVVQWFGWVPNPSGPGGNAQLESDYLAAYGAALDKAEIGFILSGAVDRAVHDLFDSDCASLFMTLNPAMALENAYKNNQIRAVPFGDGPGSPKPSVGAQTNNSVNAIYIGTDRYFFSGQFNGGPVTQTTVDFKGLTQAQVQEVILIHEMLHLTGSVGSDDNNQAITLGNAQVVYGSGGVTAAVRQHCIH